MPKRRHSSRIGRPQKRAKRGQNSPHEEYTIQDPVVGLVRAHVPEVNGQRWTDAVNTLTNNEPRFRWVTWENEGEGIVFVLEKRGNQALVVCCTQHTDDATVDFINEWKLNTKEIHVIDEECLDEDAEVTPWAALHARHDHVGDHRFHRSSPLSDQELCGGTACSDSRLGSNAAYLVCQNTECAQAFHTLCLSDEPLTYRDGDVCALSSTHPVACPKCDSTFTRRNVSAEEKNTLKIHMDIGTDRLKVVGISNDGEEHHLLDDAGAPKPLVVFGKCKPGERAQVYFQERTRDNDHPIRPIKKLFCGRQDLPTGYNKREILVLFFEKIISAIRAKFPTLEFIAKVVIVVAVPAGLDRHLQEDISNAVLNCGHKFAKGVEVIIVNEAKMSYIAGSADGHDSSGAHFALACDAGAYTLDAVLLKVDRSHNVPSIAVLRSQSLSMGDACTKEAVVKMIAENTMDDEADIRAAISERFTDSYATKSIDSTYQPKLDEANSIPFGNILAIEEEEQIKRLTHMIGDLTKDYSISECIIAGGGAGHTRVVSAIKQASQEALAPGVQVNVLPRPSSETSSVLMGMVKFLQTLPFCKNKLTVVLESASAEGQAERILMQRRGEPCERPIVPASRNIRTTFYEIETGAEKRSRHELYATTEDTKVSVNDSHFQVVTNKHDELKLIKLGTIEVDFGQTIEHNPSQWMLEAVDITLNEGHGTARAEAVLLAPKIADDKEWRSWGVKESMSVEDLRSHASDTDCRYSVIAVMEARLFCFDFDSIAETGEQERAPVVEDEVQQGGDLGQQT